MIKQLGDTRLFRKGLKIEICGMQHSLHSPMLVDLLSNCVRLNDRKDICSSLSILGAFILTSVEYRIGLAGGLPK